MPLGEIYITYRKFVFVVCLGSILNLLAIGVRITGRLIEGRAGECHEGHLDRFERQNGLLIPSGSNGERELATWNHQILSQRCADGTTI
jgi:hypothetical protein